MLLPCMQPTCDMPYLQRHITFPTCTRNLSHPLISLLILHQQNLSMTQSSTLRLAAHWTRTALNYQRQSTLPHQYGLCTSGYPFYLCLSLSATVLTSPEKIEFESDRNKNPCRCCTHTVPLGLSRMSFLL